MNRFVATPLLTVYAFTLLVTLAGTILAPNDVWPNLLIAGVFLSGLGLSGGFVVAIHDASRGNWLGPVRAIALSLTALVLPGSVIALAAIVLGGSMLYPAWHEPLHGGFKALWLDRTFFTIRAFAYVAAWLLSMQLLRRRRPAAWLLIFGVTVSFSRFDWMMSLDPHWSSTIMGVLRFSGLVTAGLATIAIVAVTRSRTDASITSDHIHDVAKLLFAFSTFWMYIWFSQAIQYYATLCSLLARSRPAVGGGSGLPSCRYSSSASSTTVHSSSNTRFSSSPWHPP